jgi:hypothetical protein
VEAIGLKTVEPGEPSRVVVGRLEQPPQLLGADVEPPAPVEVEGRGQAQPRRVAGWPDSTASIS